MTSKFLTRVGTGVVAFSILAVSAAPAFAATNVNVQGNRRNSTNNVNVNKNNTKVVSQKSKTNVVNTALVNQNTGNNKMNDAAGGGTMVTGPANSTVTLNVTGGSNVLALDECGCLDGDTNVNVSGNRRNSTNNVNVNETQTSVVSQYSNTTVVNTVSVNQNTGGNTANDSDGGVDMTTGAANSSVTTNVTGGSNVAQ